MGSFELCMEIEHGSHVSSLKFKSLCSRFLNHNSEQVRCGLPLACVMQWHRVHISAISCAPNRLHNERRFEMKKYYVPTFGEFYLNSLRHLVVKVETLEGMEIDPEDMELNQEAFLYFKSGTGLTKTHVTRIL